MVFQWRYSHEDFLLGELSQQQVLVKSQIPTPDQMSKVDKEAETKRAIKEKNKIASERDNLVIIEDVEESYSSSSKSIYSTNSNRKGSEVSSRRSPTLIKVQILE